MLVVYIVKASISEELMLVPFFLVEEVCSIQDSRLSYFSLSWQLMFQGDKVRSMTSGEYFPVFCSFFAILSGVSKVRSTTAIFLCSRHVLTDEGDDISKDCDKELSFVLNFPSGVNSTLLTLSGTDDNISIMNPSTIKADNGAGHLQICEEEKKNYFYLWISGRSKGLVVESLIPHESRIHGNNDKNKRNII